MKSVIVVAFVIVVTAVAVFFAQPSGAHPALGKVRAYQVSCTTAAGGVSLAVGQMSSALVWINSATPVYIGGTDITSTKGMPLCTAIASCVQSSVSIDSKELRCLSSSGTVTATVLVGVI